MYRRKNKEMQEFGYHGIAKYKLIVSKCRLQDY
jgi:hypothetical protein